MPMTPIASSRTRCSGPVRMASTGSSTTRAWPRPASYLIGAIHFARAVSEHMIRQNTGGRIINISSIIGSRGYNGLAAYSASKAGMDGLTRALARELGRRRITVNSIGPGYVKTEMSATLTPPQLAQIVNRTPLGRLASEDDITALLRFLLSDGAGMITGQVILVDGGVSC